MNGKLPLSCYTAVMNNWQWHQWDSQVHQAFSNHRWSDCFLHMPRFLSSNILMTPLFLARQKKLISSFEAPCWCSCPAAEFRYFAFPSKCDVACDSVYILVHHVSHVRVSMTADKVETVCSMKFPQTPEDWKLKLNFSTTIENCWPFLLSRHLGGMGHDRRSYVFYIQFTQ